MLSGYYWPIVGGVMIGAASVILLLMNGRLAGISSVFWGAIERSSPGKVWRWLFLIGLMAGGWLYHALTGNPYPSIGSNYPLAIAAGLLVGIGVKIGNGCTSGHGVCGIGRLSPRSIVATIAFMLAGIVTVFIFNLFTQVGAA
jgi:uncharacterized membrane protein YedE/YeeE